MFKKAVMFLLNLFTSSSLALGAMQDEPESFPPPRPDQLEAGTQMAEIRLERARTIFSTLITNTEEYELILSSTPSIGGEAVPPYVFSDKPTIILYQGLLSPARTDEEVAFVMAHELGHIVLGHHYEMDEQMDQIFNGHPIQISGTTFTTYFQKQQEQQADLFGLDLYRQAGYDLSFFARTLSLIKINPNTHFGTSNPFRKPLSSLSWHGTHYSILERFELLTKKAKI